MTKPPQLEQGSQSEDGFILLAVLFLVMLVLIGLAVAAPKMARSIQRDKELELVHRGEQYKRAIRLYYKKFGAYPTTIDQLVETNKIRFLRKRYKDPLTGKDDWRLIHLGEAKVPPMGLFGQPLIGLGGVPGAAGSAVTAVPGAVSATGTTAGSTPFGTASVDTPDNSDTGSDSTDSVNGSTSVESAANNPSVTITGTAPAQTAAGITPAGTASTPFGTSTTSSTGPTFGGPIVGVGVPVTKASLIDYKKQKHYNQWEFVYNPLEEQMLAGGGLAGAGAQGANPTGTGIGNPTGTVNGSGSPTTPPAGTTPSSPTTPSQPQ